MIYDADFERDNCPLALHKNNFKRYKRTTSRSHEVDYFNFHFSTAFFLSFCPSIRFMKIWQCWIRICIQTSTHTHLLVNCTFSYSPDSDLFYSSFHFFFFRARPKPHLFQASFLAFVKRREARGLGDSSCWKKEPRLDFKVFMWTTAKNLDVQKFSGKVHESWTTM